MKKILFFLLISNFMLAQWSISNAERSALISLYNNTNGEHWSTGWDFSKDPKSWYGIKIKNGSVIEINLKGNALKGNFPSSLGAFLQLQKLDLSSNQLQGNVLGSISGLTNLVRLDLSNNRLTGDPSSILMGLSQLKELSLGNNLFVVSNLDSFLQSFQQIKILDLSHFGLTQIPQKLSSYSALQTLILSNNNISQNFSVLNNLTALSELDLSGNQLNAIPSSLAHLSNLKILNLSNNKLNSTSVSVLASLSNLEWLSLEANQFNNLPSEMSQLRKLIHLNLGRNQLSGGFSALVALPELQQIFLNDNLVNSYPTEVLNLKKLQMLSLSSNQLEGTIPANTPSITFLDNNRFTELQLKNFLQLKTRMADFSYSPQRYDEQKTIVAALHTNTNLTQSLSGEDYSFTWYKNLSENTHVFTPNYPIFDVQTSDYGKYTVEAYYLKKHPDFLMEVSFFREPITLEQELGTEEIFKGLVIYPNPTSDFLHIKTKNLTIEEAVIFDLSGKLILKTKANLLQVKHLPEGMYLLSIKTEKGTKTFKWIKSL